MADDADPGSDVMEGADMVMEGGELTDASSDSGCCTTVRASRGHDLPRGLGPGLRVWRRRTS